MFRSPSVNLIISDTGFAVQILGRTGLHYSVGNRRLFVDSEVLTAEPAMVIYSQSIKHWDPPYERILIGAEERAEIVQNIRLALGWQGHEIDVI